MTDRKRTRAFTVNELSELWNVTPQFIRDKINGGDLIARNISSGKRATFRIRPEDADAFWDSLSNLKKKRPLRSRDRRIDVSSSSFSDFIK